MIGGGEGQGWVWVTYRYEYNSGHDPVTAPDDNFRVATLKTHYY